MKPIHTLLPIGAAVVAALAFSGQASRWLVLILLLPVLVAWTPARWLAALTMATYAAVMTRGIPASVITYYADPAPLTAYGLWLALIVLYAGLGALLWHPDARQRQWRIPVLLLLWTLPPFGLIGWGNPLTATGWLLPGTGWVGLLVVIPLLMGCSRYPVMLILPGLLVVIPLSGPAFQAPLTAPAGWHTHSTRYPMATASRPESRQIEFTRHQALIRQLTDQPFQLYPEAVGGRWNPVAARWWQRQLQPGQTVLIGATTTEAGRQYNSVIEITPAATRAVYHQRMPLPVTMWKPGPDGYSPNWSQPDTVRIGQTRTAILLCNEILLAAPALQSLSRHPQQLVTLASVWWAPAYVHPVQSATAQSWARLFGLPLLEAFNG
ncbi:MAG: hypothetical protein KDI44_16445 [Thiothrix sp.]|nr:hypothetical protein [Thiothrix sp.]